MEPLYANGTRVDRREDREITGGVVIASETGEDGPVYLIAYDEGGQGWWPEGDLDAEA